jgi:hypothetical protein
MSMTFKQPKKTCDDRNCPFHGTLSIRGRVLEGIVHTAKMDKTVISLTENSHNSHQNSYVTNADTVTSHHTTHHALTLKKATA